MKILKPKPSRKRSGSLWGKKKRGQETSCGTARSHKQILAHGMREGQAEDEDARVV